MAVGCCAHGAAWRLDAVRMALCGGWMPCAWRCMAVGCCAHGAAWRLDGDVSTKRAANLKG
eukprot:357759-Chlamydomonas_euryale.AAC.8